MPYKYLNLNPLGFREEDCVCRAISLASGYSYAQIKDKLYYVSQLLECEELCICCYHHLLDDVFKYDRLDCQGMTVEEVANLFPNGTLLCRLEGHLTCIIDGICYDTWDCTDLKVDIVWIVD